MNTQIRTPLPFADLGKRRVLGIGEWAAVRSADASEIVTHALGSCVGIALWDPHAQVGGMLHAQLPSAAGNPNSAVDPGRYVDTGWALLYKGVLALGAEKSRIRVTMAGGANPTQTANDMFAIGKRNLTAMRKMLWNAGLLVAGEECGGVDPRTMHLELTSGRTIIETAGRKRDL